MSKSKTIIVAEKRFISKIDDIPKEYQFNMILKPEDFAKKYREILDENSHVIVLGGDILIRDVAIASIEKGASVGIVSVSENKLSNSFSIPKDFQKSLEIAFSKENLPIDILKCNDNYSLYSCEVGEKTISKVRNKDFSHSFFEKLIFLLRSIKRGFQLVPIDLKIRVGSEREINTVASSLIFIENDRDMFVSNLIKDDINLNDGTVSLIIISPLSVIEYLSFIFQSLQKRTKKILPQAVSFIKSNKIEISSRNSRKILIDDFIEDVTPATFEIKKGGLKLSLSKELIENYKKSGGSSGKESFKIENLPTEREKERLLSKKIEFFTSASEERYQKLFSQIRSDANSSMQFINLMILSSTLATLGLFLGSASVIIGAMVLAPLMAPIISLSMGFLRNEKELGNRAFKTLSLGILIALSISYFITLSIPLNSETSEILARTQPNILDLFVAFISGIAGAYAKGDDGVAQNIAGVAIAVALVPPIAVAGIGLGWGEMWIFSGASLLFLANFFGIILASSLTFILMGFSPIKVAKRGVAISLAFAILITFPLYISFKDTIFQNSLKERVYTLDYEYGYIENVKVTKKGLDYKIKVEIVVETNRDYQQGLLFEKDLKTLFPEENIEIILHKSLRI
jgi:uncharacterized hydrophobic protein (TIGR00271 family)